MPSRNTFAVTGRCLQYSHISCLTGRVCSIVLLLLLLLLILLLFRLLLLLLKLLLLFKLLLLSGGGGAFGFSFKAYYSTK